MPARLYVVPASHPSAAVAKALEIKGIPFETIHLVPVFHKAHQKAVFGGAATVPGLKLEDGRKLLGSRHIIRELDKVQPEPRLVSDDRRVIEAEEWGDEVLQNVARRLAWQILSRKPKAQLSYAEGVKLRPPVPRAVAGLSGGMVGWAERKINKASDDAVRADVANLPAHLDRVDRWLADGVLGGEQLNAADLQIASSLRLMLTMGDLAPSFEGRPCADYARRVFPVYPGHAPAGGLPS
jgi:glutathione S-transferase